MNKELEQLKAINEEIEKADKHLAALRKTRNDIQEKYPEFDRHVIREALNIGFLESHTHPCIYKIRTLTRFNKVVAMAYNAYEDALISEYDKINNMQSK